MNLKKYMENRIRGWFPKEPIGYSIKRTMTARGLAIYFSLILIITALLRIFIVPLFLPPSLTEATDESILMFLLTGAILAVVYYIKTRGSQKQIRLFYFIGIGGGLGFPIWVGAMLISKAITGYYIQGFDLQLTYALSYTAAFIIGIPASKKIQQRFPVRL